MRKRSFKPRSFRRSSVRAKKPWEDRVWFPYMGNSNLSWADETGAVTDLALVSAADVKRVVIFQPSLMDPSNFFQPSNVTGVPPGIDSENVSVKRMQGHVHFDADMYASGSFRPDQAASQAGAWMRVWYSWQKEIMTTGGYVQNIADTGFGPGVLSDVKQLMNRHLMSYGVIDWCRPSYPPATGAFTGENKGDRTYVIPNPKLPPAGLRLKQGEALTLIVRASYGRGYGRDLAQDVTNSVALPMRMHFQPLLRFLCAR